MPMLKCVKDEMGYWTEGEIYIAEHVGCGLLSVGDDDDPNAEWAAHPKDWKDGDDEAALTYHIPGCDYDIEFIEVEGNI